MLPVVVGALALNTVVDTFSDVSTFCVNVAKVMDIPFHQTVQQKKLACMISSNYTTDTKNVVGSIIPEVSSNGGKELKSDVLEELVHALLNKKKS